MTDLQATLTFRGVEDAVNWDGDEVPLDEMREWFESVGAEDFGLEGVEVDVDVSVVDDGGPENGRHPGPENERHPYYRLVEDGHMSESQYLSTDLEEVRARYLEAYGEEGDDGS